MKFLTSLLMFVIAAMLHATASAAVFCGAKNPLMLCGINEISTDLQLDLTLGSAMEAFKELLMPLALFSTRFSDVRLQGTNKLQVAYYPLETAASKDFDGTYKFDGTDTQSREVTINKRKYQSLAFTSEEWNRQPFFDPERLGRLKGQKLAEDVLTDILSVITLANYGVHIFAGAAGSFDYDTVIDIETAVTTAKWPVTQRGLLLKPAYVGNIKKDMIASGGMATFGRTIDGETVTFPTIESFSVAVSNVIPSNGENLVGAAVYPSAILVGMSPIEPAPAVRARLASYRIESDDDIGIALEYREWGDADSDTEKRTIEANYGYAPGEAAALRRILSVAP